MKMNKKRISTLLGLAIFSSLAVSLPACSKGGNQSSHILRYQDLDGCTFATTPANAVYNNTIKTKLPNAKFEVYANYVDTFTEVANGRKDAAFVFKNNFLPVDMNFNGELTCIELPFVTPICAGFSSSAQSAFKDDFNDFINESALNGEIDELSRKWFKNFSKVEDTFDFSNFASTKGTFKVALPDDNMPYSFFKNSKPSGFEVEFLHKFCSEKQWGIEFNMVPYSAMLSGLETNKYDVVLGSIGVTEEKKESIEFSNPYVYDNYAAAVKKNRVPGAAAKYKSFKELEGKTIGLLDGCAYVDYSKTVFSKSNFKYFKSNADSYVALNTKKVLQCKTFLIPNFLQIIF